MNRALNLPRPVRWGTMRATTSEKNFETLGCARVPDQMSDKKDDGHQQ
jgi:hypothetical protein